MHAHVLLASMGLNNSMHLHGVRLSFFFFTNKLADLGLAVVTASCSIRLMTGLASHPRQRLRRLPSIRDLERRTGFTNHCSLVVPLSCFLANSLSAAKFPIAPFTGREGRAGSGPVPSPLSAWLLKGRAETVTLTNCRRGSGLRLCSL